MSKSLFLFFVILTIQLSAFSQLGRDLPLMSEKMLQHPQIAVRSIQSPDIEKALKEDALDANKDVSPRFGLPIEVNLDFYANASQVDFPDGAVLYALALSAQDAKSLNLIFSSFDLPNHAWMHIYNADKSEILGAFTEENESEEHFFATTLLSGDEIILEVYHKNGTEKGNVVIDKLIYGYRDLKQLGSFGSSGDCNVNVICEEGNAWRAQIQSVLLLISGGSNNRICTGTLINNTLEDGAPYMLSAAHCPLNPSNVAVFNYQSPTCDPGKDSSFIHSINGMTLLAAFGESDFELSRLSSKPPSAFNAYYAGWNNSGDIPKRGVGIHHPKGDVKKISFDFDRLVSSGYYTHGNDHWKVESWDIGTTEVISSGSPIFDEQKLLVGQLHGGDASCQDDAEDYYGKFSHSWNARNDSSKQLKYWLDPLPTGGSILYGFNPNRSKDSYDLANLGFVSSFQREICNSNVINPEIVVKNRGNQPITQCKVDFYLDNVLVNTVNSGSISLSPDSTQLISTSIANVSSGVYTLRAEIDILGQNDQNSSNNVAQTEINVVNQGNRLELILKTDNAGDETSWNIQSNTGAIIYEGGGYPGISGGGIFRDTFCLDDACYRLNFFDDWGDGICCGFGQGYYVLRYLSTFDTLFHVEDFTGSDTSHAFCLGDSCGIKARATIVASTSSSTSDGSIELDMILGNPPFQFIWSNGGQTSKIENLNPGLYTVIVSDSLGCTDSLEFEVPLGTSVKSQQNAEKKMILFPNPSRGKFTLKGLNPGIPYRIQVLDMRGQVLLETESVMKVQIEMDLRAFSKGMYLLRITSSQNTVTKRMVIQP